MPLVPELGFVPDLDAIDAETARRAKLLFVNYPNNPTGAIVPDGFFERLVEFARVHDILVVHDAAYTETAFDGYVPPSFLATPGAAEVGVEVFSLSKGYNMTGWRCAAIVGNADALQLYWRLKTNIDSGLFEAVQLAGAAALAPEVDAEVARMNAIYTRRRDLVCEALAAIGVDVTPPRATIYVWAPGAGRLRQRRRVLRARARGGRRRHLPGRGLRTERGGLVPDLAHDARRTARRGRAAPRPAWRRCRQRGDLHSDVNGAQPATVAPPSPRRSRPRLRAGRVSARSASPRSPRATT